MTQLRQIRQIRKKIHRNSEFDAIASKIGGVDRYDPLFHQKEKGKL